MWPSLTHKSMLVKKSLWCQAGGGKSVATMWLLQSPVTLLIVITWKISLESRAATAASFRSVSIRYWSWAPVYDIISWPVMYGGDVSTAGTRILGICLSMRSLHRRCMIKSAMSTYIFLLALIITAPVCTPQICPQLFVCFVKRTFGGKSFDTGQLA